jgi:sugar O-acyltransferase (sialic acid O-acetyltransferase NeuD family)
MLVILGSGGHAKVLRDIASGDVVLSGKAMDEFWHRLMTHWYAGTEVLTQYQKSRQFILGVGDMPTRLSIIDKFRDYGFTWATLSAGETYSSTIGEGTAVLYNAVVNRAEIGRHCVIGCGAVVEHDTRIGDHTLIGPGAVICGTCIIGQRVEIGPGVTIGKNTWICDDVTIGAGAVVVRDITTPGRYLGVPARAA